MNKRLLFLQRVTHVVGGMAGREDAAEMTGLACDHIAVAHRHIGHEITVAAFFDIAVMPSMRAIAISLRASGVFQRRGSGRMIAVGMGDENVIHFARADRSQQRFDMLGIVRPRIDHRHAFVIAHQIDAGAAKGEGAGIVRQQPLDARRQAFSHAIDRRQRLVEMQFGCGHG